MAVTPWSWTASNGTATVAQTRAAYTAITTKGISENVTWGQRKRFADGKVSLPYKNFLGYKRGEDGRPEIVEKEAKIVRMIWTACLQTFCKPIDKSVSL